MRRVWPDVEASYRTSTSDFHDRRKEPRVRPLSQLPRAAVVTVALAGSLSLAVAGSAVATPAGSASSSGRIAVPNAQPDLSGATATGASAGSQQIDVTLYLADQRAAELAALVTAVSTPGSAQYGKYLTPAQFRARYAPSKATVASVREFLADSGLSVAEVASNRAYVRARGTVAKMQKAFGTSLKKYTVEGQ